jgi:cytochrome c-type biogenesis protein CcmH/NrfG
MLLAVKSGRYLGTYMLPRTRSRRLALLVLLAIVTTVSGAAYLAYQRQQQLSVRANLPAAAEAAYERGRQALAETEGGPALAAFAEASLLTEKALADLDDEKLRTKNPNAEKARGWDARRGKLLWNKALVLRDRAFAQAIVDGTPIAEIDDSITREKFRSVAQIPNAPEQQEAILSIREAAVLLPNDLAVQQELLRLQMLFGAVDWDDVQRIARNLIRLDPQNVRARFLLARFEFEQPKQSGSVKKDSSRVEAARDHLQVVKLAPFYPLWRTLGLEAQILYWRVKQAPDMSAEARREEDLRLRDLLFNPETGALVRANRHEDFTALSRFDVEGLMTLHLMAVELANDDRRTGRDVRSNGVIDVLNLLFDVSLHLSNSDYGKPFRGAILKDNVAAATRARQVLGKETPAQWLAVVDRLDQLAARMADGQVSQPGAYAGLAQILNNEAHLAGRSGNRAGMRVLEERALAWVDKGLKLAGAAKAPLKEVIDLHAIALETHNGRGDAAASLEPHLSALRKVSNEPRAAAIVALQEALILIHHGKLETAWVSLDSILGNPHAVDLRPRVLMLLAHLALSMQKHAMASAALAELDNIYARVEGLSPAESAWNLEFLGDPKDVPALLVIAELETAVEKLRRLRQEAPFAKADAATQLHEGNALRFLSRLPKGTDAHRRACATFADYYLRTGQRDKAVESIQLLKLDYPPNLDVLRLDVAIALTPERGGSDDASAAAKRTKVADELIQAFMTANPANSSGKLFWVDWLIRSQRSEEALTYLAGKPGFFKDQDQAAKRRLAVALLKTGDPKAARQALQQLPKDSSIDAFLVQITAAPELREQLLHEAMSRHEDNGLFRIWEGERLLGEGKHAEAARMFRETYEFTRVKPSAQLGLLRSMLNLAEREPVAALQMAEEFGQESPQDAMFYAVAAYAALRRNDLGVASDVWGRSKSMHACLNRWQAAARENGVDSESAALFRSQFWQLANRPDLAWNELEPVASARSSSEAVLLQMVRLALLPGADDHLAEATIYLDALKGVKGIRIDRSALRLLEARLLIRRGNADAAIQLLEWQLEVQPNYLDAYPILVKALNDRGLTDRAVLMTERWSKLAPLDPVAILEGIRQDLAAGRVAKGRNKSEAFVVDSAARVANRFDALRETSFEKLKLERLRAVRSAACLALAQTWLQAGQAEGAEQFLARCLKEEPQNQSAQLLLAQAALSRKDWLKARAIYEEVLRNEPGSFVAQINLAWLLAEHFDQPVESLQIVRRVMARPFGAAPTAGEKLTPECLDVLGKVFLKANPKQAEENLLAEMVKVFEAASRQYPFDPRCFLHLGQAHAGLAENEEAAKAYQNALQLAQAGKGPFSVAERKEFIRKTTELLMGPSGPQPVK